MWHPKWAALALVILSAQGLPRDSRDGTALTFEQALALARERSPSIRAARARIEEARARLTAAAIRMRGNTVVEGGAGRRSANGEEFNEVDIGISQGLGAAGRRAARIDGAQADVSRENAAGDDVVVRSLRDVAETFLRGLHADERVRLLEAAADVAEETARVAGRRFEAGDVAALDVGVAEASLARARSEVLAAQADLEAFLGALRILIGMDAGQAVSLSGDLGALPEPPPDLSELLERAEQRPDARALAAGIEQAEADARLGRTFRQPEFDVGLRYEREEDADVVLGTLSISLPAFDRGQGLAAEAGARAERLRIEREALLRAVQSEVRTAYDVSRRRREAAAAIRAVLPVIAENERLALRSYETGQVSLAEFLIVRRDALEARMTCLDRALEAAVAGIRLEASAGVRR